MEHRQKRHVKPYGLHIASVSFDYTIRGTGGGLTNLLTSKMNEWTIPFERRGDIARISETDSSMIEDMAVIEAVSSIYNITIY